MRVGTTSREASSPAGRILHMFKSLVMLSKTVSRSPYNTYSLVDELCTQWTKSFRHWYMSRAKPATTTTRGHMAPSVLLAVLWLRADDIHLSLSLYTLGDSIHHCIMPVSYSQAINLLSVIVHIVIVVSDSFGVRKTTAI